MPEFTNIFNTGKFCNVMTFDENNRVHMAWYRYLCNVTVILWKIMFFLVYMYYMHTNYWTSIVG